MLIKPNILERTLMLTLNAAPAPTLDMYSVIANRAVMVALKLDVFETLKDDRLTAHEMAEKANVDERGLTLLLEGLEAIGYLQKEDGRYINTPMTKNANRLLDLGAGHGNFSVKFCQKYPGLSATLIDWPQALSVAKATIATENIQGRITFLEGDMWSDDLGSEFDIALLFNIIHMYSPDKNYELIQRAAGALKGSGMLVIMDQIAGRGSGSAAKAIARLQGLQLFNSVMGQTYSFQEITKWLSKAGFTDVQCISLRKAPSSGLAIAKRP